MGNFSEDDSGIVSHSILYKTTITTNELVCREYSLQWKGHGVRGSLPTTLLGGKE